MPVRRYADYLTLLGPMVGCCTAKLINGSAYPSWVAVFTVCGLLIWRMGMAMVNGWEEFTTAAKKAYAEEKDRKKVHLLG